jgi:hypothetical protein
MEDGEFEDGGWRIEDGVAVWLSLNAGGSFVIPEGAFL